MNVDAVAEALKKAWLEHEDTDIPDTLSAWTDTGYRSMAIAAVEAMGLIEEWAVSRDGYLYSKRDRQEAVYAAKLSEPRGFKDFPVSRLVSPWVRTGQ